MVKDIVIRSLCNVCNADGRTEVATLTDQVVTVGSGKPVTIDLCEACAEPVRRTLELLAAYGESTEPPPPPKPPRPKRVSEQGGEFRCPHCSKPPYTLIGSLRYHMEQAHPGESMEVLNTGDIPCPEEGCDRKFQSLQGVTAHRRAGHKLVGQPWPTNGKQPALTSVGD